MKRNRVKSLLAGAVLCMVLRPAVAQQDAVDAPAIPPAKAALIHKLIEVTNAANLGTMVMDQVISALKPQWKHVPDSFWNDFRSGIKPGDLEAMVVPIYAKHFDEADLQALIDFYSSPVGKRVVNEMPAVMQESMTAGQAWGRALAQRAIDQAKAKGYPVTS
jgi:hypothetical protein